MSGLISANYRIVDPLEVQAVAAQLAAAWQDAAIPQRQYDLCVKQELEALHKGRLAAPFDALTKLLRNIDQAEKQLTFLDVGAATGCYQEVITAAGINHQYRACDYSLAFRRLAAKLYPGIQYDIEDAAALSYGDDRFEVVLNSGVLIHTLSYAKVIAETARVSNRYAIFHRVPLATTLVGHEIVATETKFFVKEAYGVRCLEIHFNETELLELFSKNNLSVLNSIKVAESGQVSYLCCKMIREWERA